MADFFTQPQDYYKVGEGYPYGQLHHWEMCKKKCSNIMLCKNRPPCCKLENLVQSFMEAD